MEGFAKKFLSILLVMLLFCSVLPVAYADGPAPCDVGEGEVAPCAEETRWYYRQLEDGSFEKRLWSHTYGKWLTDWIPCT